MTTPRRRSTDDILSALESDGILTVLEPDIEMQADDPRAADPVLDPIVTRLGGSVFSRHGNEHHCTTVYRWENGEEASRVVDEVRRVVLAMDHRDVGEVGGHGPRWLILVVDRSARVDRPARVTQ